MRLTPKHLLFASRLALGAAILVSGVLLFGPASLAEHLVGQVLPWDKAAHFVGFYGLTTLTLLSFPARRRADLTIFLMLCGISSELIQSLVGRDCEFGDFIADTFGILAVSAPMSVARLRALIQAEPNTSLAALKGRDRRAASKREPSLQGRRATAR